MGAASVAVTHGQVLASPEASRTNLLGYIPSIPLNVIGIVVFGLIALAHTWLHARSKARYMLAMTIGAYFYTAGIADRFAYRSNTVSLGIFLIQNLFIILSPCAFIASCYAILGQLGTRLDARDYLPIRPERISKIFIWSDVATFLIQSGGGGLEVNASSANLGSKIFLGGLLLQLLSFLLFCALYVVFLLRLRERQPTTFATGTWRPLGLTLAIACTGIIVRSVFRTVENSQGFGGYLSVHEGYFWALDALPLAIAVGAFVFCWPEGYLPSRHATVEMAAMGSREMIRGEGSDMK